MMMRFLSAVALSLAAITGAAAFAGAEMMKTPAPSPTASSQGGSMMKGGSMMRGQPNMEMMSRMMGNDPASACNEMMQAILHDPAAHRAMNEAMRRAFSTHSPAPATTGKPR